MQWWFIVIYSVSILLTSCSQMTETYQRAVYGQTFTPAAACPEGMTRVGLACKPKPGGAS